MYTIGRRAKGLTSSRKTRKSSRGGVFLCFSFRASSSYGRYFTQLLPSQTLSFMGLFEPNFDSVQTAQMWQRKACIEPKKQCRLGKCLIKVKICLMNRNFKCMYQCCLRGLPSNPVTMLNQHRSGKCLIKVRICLMNQMNQNCKATW